MRGGPSFVLKAAPEIKSPLLLRESVQACLGDGLVDLGFGAAGGDASQRFAVHLDGQTTLIGKEFGEGQGLDAAFLYGVGGVLGGAAVEGGVASFLLRPLQGVERRGVTLLEKEEIAAFVDDDDGDADLALFGFGFGSGDHGLNRGEVDIFFGGEIGGKGWGGEG